MWNYYIDSLVLLIKTEEVYGLPTITVESSSWSLSSFWRSLQWDPLPEHQAAVSACLSLTYFPIRVWEPPAFTLSLQGFICHTVKSYHYAFLGLETDYQAVSLVSMHVLSFFLILECVFGGGGGWWRWFSCLHSWLFVFADISKSIPCPPLLKCSTNVYIFLIKLQLCANDYSNWWGENDDFQGDRVLGRSDGVVEEGKQLDKDQQGLLHGTLARALWEVEPMPGISLFSRRPGLPEAEGMGGRSGRDGSKREGPETQPLLWAPETGAGTVAKHEDSSQLSHPWAVEALEPWPSGLTSQDLGSLLWNSSNYLAGS